MRKGLFTGACALGLIVAGWQIVRPEPVLSHGRITTSIVFNREVSQIFQKKPSTPTIPSPTINWD